MNIEKSAISRGLLEGILPGIMTIIVYYGLYLFGYWLLEPWWLRIVFLIAMAMFSIHTGAIFVCLSRGAATSPVALIAYSLTLSALALYLGVAEMQIFTIITIASAIIMKLAIWANDDIKKESLPLKSLSEKT